jgi:cell division protein FtsQ
MAVMATGSVIVALIVVLAVAGVIGRTVRAVRGMGDAIVADAGFGVYEIQINGNRRVPTKTIFAALGLTAGQSIFNIDLPAARARILALDWIASADVVRRYPDAITVTVVEKRPFALWQSPQGIAVVERAGGIITTQGVDEFARLPKLVGEGAPAHAADLVDAAMAHRAIAARIAAYQRVSDRRWNLILKDGVVVKLPETGWQKQLDDLENLIVDKGILEKNVTEIDLREPSHYFFLLKGGEQKTIAANKDKET